MAKPDGSGNGQSRRSYLKATGVIGAGALAGCVGGPGSGEESPGDGGGGGSGPIQIGQPAALTGNFDYLQEGVTMVTDMVVDQINEAGGPLGREFGVIRRDTEINPQQFRNVVDQMISADGVQVISGGFSSEIPPNWDFIQSQEIPVITHWPGARFLDNRGGDKGTPEDTSDDEWVWRTITSDSVATAGAMINASNQGVSSVAVMHGPGAGQVSEADGWAAAATVMDGIEVVANLEIQAGASSYSSALNRVFQNDFDALAVSLALEDSITLVRDYNSAGYDTDLMFAQGVKVEDFPREVGGTVPERTWISLAGASGPYQDQLISQFDSAHGTNNMGDHNHSWAKATYDAVTAIALAIHAAGSYEKNAIEQNLGPITREGGTKVMTFADGKEALDNDEDINFQGAMSPCNFTPDGNVASDTTIFSPTSSGWETVNTVDADAIREVISSDDYPGGDTA